MGSNPVCNLQTGICEINQNYYSLCRPTLFPLRFIGGPTGLWQFRTPFVTRTYRKVCALIMMVAMNMGAAGNCYFTMRATCHSNHTFSQNINMFYVLAISISGVLGLDILWWKRRTLIELLKSIDFEPKMCEVMDAKCNDENEKEIRNKTIKMFLFMLFFSGYTNWIYATSTTKSMGPAFLDYTSLRFHAHVLMFTLGFIAIYPFSVIMSLYISLSWIFRLKIKRIIQYIREDIDLIQNNHKPPPFHAKAIELWFSLYLVQFKKYDQIFKQIAGLIYLVMVFSILSFAEDSLTSIFKQRWVGNNSWDTVHEGISIACLVYFLYSLSNVEHSLRRYVKLLYRLSLRIKFLDLSDESASDLSEKYQLLGETVGKSGLNVTLFGLMHINRNLIITTFSILLTYGLLMYELFGNENSEDKSWNSVNSTTSSSLINKTNFV